MKPQEETFKILYNAKHGGYGLSNKCIEEYNRRTGSNYNSNHDEVEIERDDPVLVELVETMGDIMNGPYCKLKVKEFSVRYKEFLGWNEYDGKESVYINYDKYLIYHTRCIKDSNQTAEEKLLRLEELYKEYDERHAS